MLAEALTKVLLSEDSAKDFTLQSFSEGEGGLASLIPKGGSCIQ